jgi:hypothetical protein
MFLWCTYQSGEHFIETQDRQVTSKRKQSTNQAATRRGGPQCEPDPDPDPEHSVEDNFLSGFLQG